MKCPECNSLVIHTYTTRLNEDVNIQLRYNICEKQHTFPTVELIGKWRSRGAEITQIELSDHYRKYLQPAERPEEVGAIPEPADIPG